jgi:energy-coupling factor transporter ATP-binding protein EcfA2
VDLLSLADASTPLAGVDLTVRDRRVRVRSELAESVRLLEDTFYPEGTFGVRVRPIGAEPDDHFDLLLNEISCDRLQLDSLAGDARKAARRCETYSPTVGTSAEKLCLDRATVYFDSEADGTPALFIRRGKRLDLVSAPSRAQHRRVTRVVRAWATGLAEQDGEICLHASAFVFDGRAYLVIGDAGAGKSTFSLAAAYFYPRAAWLGNDRIHVSAAPPHVVRACPMPLAINKGTLEVLGIRDFAAWKTAEAVPSDHTDWASFDGSTKWKLAPREVQKFFGVELAVTAPLGGMIFPRVRFDSAYSVKEASLSEMENVLERNCFSLRDTLYADDWLGVRPATSGWRPILRRLVQDLQGLPVFTVTTTRPEDTRRAVEAVLRACADGIAPERLATERS